MSRYKYHLFICQNERPDDDPRGCCLHKHSHEILERFRQLIKEHGLQKTVRANVAGCLSNCSRGPTIVVYPEEVWYSYVKLEDVDEIFKEHILAGKPVVRLLDYQDK